ncbi:MAG TPA: acyltransferase [Ktedonobacteraceae bacterium]|nr:acyltransferase [Ktedonobacteraceae bacterium]
MATKNIASLEGLRAFAAIGVVTLHITYLAGRIIVNPLQYPWLASFWVFGNTGVQLFFVLSGFLLFMPYAKALLFQEKWPSTPTFYLRRVLRIAPGYYFSLLVLVLFVQQIYLQPDHWAQFFLFLTFLMDSSKTTFQQINVPYWSLAVEVQFYLLLPLVARGIYLLLQHAPATPFTRMRVALLACLGLIVFGIIVRYLGWQFPSLPAGSPGLLVFLFTITRFLFFGTAGKFWESFAIGMIVSLCFIYAQHTEHGIFWQRTLQKISLFTGLAALVVLTFCAFWNFRASYPAQQLNFLQIFLPYRNWLMEFFVSLGWGLLILTILAGHGLFKAPFEWKLVRHLGIISYTIYLWHLPLLTLFKKYILAHLSITNIALSHLAYWSFFTLVIIPWCILIYWLVEKPFMRIKDRQKLRRAL